MRILVLIHEFPPIGGGGGQVAKDICQELHKQGHEIVLITAHKKGLPRREVIDGIQVIRQPSFRRQEAVADLLAMGAYILLSLFPALWLIRTWKPDLIHVHFAVPAGALAWILSRLTGTPYLLTVHLGDVPGGVPEKTENWFRWFFPFTPAIWHDAAQVVSVSHFTRQLAAKYYPVDVAVIPNGVDLAKLDPGEIRVGLPPTIVFAGRFVQQKNPLQIVRILSDLKDLPWTCVMLGDGPLREEVQGLVRDYGLHDRFSLPGWIHPDEVLKWFARSDILFHPSLSEGLPVVGVQALAMGLAIVASQVGGYTEIVENDRNGYLFPPDDAAGMRNALRILLSDPDKLLESRQQSRKFASRFDLNNIVSSYTDFFREVVGR